MAGDMAVDRHIYAAIADLDAMERLKRVSNSQHSDMRLTGLIALGLVFRDRISTNERPESKRRLSEWQRQHHLKHLPTVQS